MINADIQMNAQAMLRVSAKDLMGKVSQTTPISTNLYYATTREKAQPIIQNGLRKGDMSVWPAPNNRSANTAI